MLVRSTRNRRLGRARRPGTLGLRRALILSLSVILAAARSVASAGDGRDQPSEQQIVAWLRELKPLPKVHYSWPIPHDRLRADDALILEYVRLTHAVSLSGKGGITRGEIDAAVQICKTINDTDPEIAATIAINCSPWHRWFGEDLPPTDTGATHRAELRELRDVLEFIRSQITVANRRLGSNVRVSAIIYDCERFNARANDSQWNAAITAKFDLAYDIARELFPDARIEWYNRGQIGCGASPNGWSQSRICTLEEKGSTFACSLYHVPEIEITRETFRRTAANAKRHGVTEVTPWVALAAGHRRRPDVFHEWSFDWDYDLIYSWQLGLEINQPWWGAGPAERDERFAPWRRAHVVVFYPEPFGRSPAWGKHFVAYVRGANRVKVLPGEEHTATSKNPATQPK